MEWTREKTLSLISEYRKRRGLWDMTHDDYRKKEIKQKLLVEVSGSLGGGIPIVEIEKKFHTLRTQYHREINRMKRNEPYNSKWFGFKNLQFLSSPKACRSNKGRIKSEITEEGTVTTKYIIREATHDTSGGSANSSSNMNEEFLTIHRKPTITTYEAVNSAPNTVATGTSRSHELEKLIEETTKDVEEVEEAKPKMTIKEITVPIEHHHSYNTQIHAATADELTAVDQDPLQHHQQQHHHHQQQQQQHMEEDEEEPNETIGLQGNEDEIAYHSSSSTGGGGAVHTQTTTVHHHHNSVPTRIIKIQRRDTCQEDEYYDEEQQPQQTQQQQQQHHIHSVPPGSAKRIYYETNGHHHTVLTNPAATSQANSVNVINPAAKLMQQNNRNSLVGQAQQTSSQANTPQSQIRDEFSTYGEYVANEMRGIANREILVALKHKINTALFEASMAELQK